MGHPQEPSARQAEAILPMRPSWGGTGHKGSCFLRAAGSRQDKAAGGIQTAQWERPHSQLQRKRCLKRGFSRQRGGRAGLGVGRVPPPPTPTTSRCVALDKPPSHRTLPGLPWGARHSPLSRPHTQAGSPRVSGGGKVGMGPIHAPRGKGFKTLALPGRE